MRATVNPRNNLAHCSACQKNLNNIDLLISLDYDFLAAVALLERCSRSTRPRGPGRKLRCRPRKRTSAMPARSRVGNSASDASSPRRAIVLQNSQQFGKPALNNQKTIQVYFGKTCAQNLARRNYNVKLTTRKAYGFRTFRAVEVASYHRLGDLPESELAHRLA